MEEAAAHRIWPFRHQPAGTERCGEALIRQPDSCEPDAEYESVDAGRVLAKMDAARNGMNIVILDACRNNPYTHSFRNASHGLATLNAPSGTFIACATASGSLASNQLA